MIECGSKEIALELGGRSASGRTFRPPGHAADDHVEEGATTMSVAAETAQTTRPGSRSARAAGRSFRPADGEGAESRAGSCAAVRVPLSAGQEPRFVTVARQMGKWVDHVLGQGYHSFSPAEAWRPAVNICEDSRQYCIVVDLAGMKVADIDLRAEKGRLVLAGERPLPEFGKHRGEVRLHTLEIDHGRFSRTMSLPPDADVENIEAFYRNGYLWIRVPKRR